ncbi:MAG: D-alanyl-D-alanine carboxypeptidase [Firmicutes bacterium]|nr:D-alanyl-D-alanine carboxypeptidase [Bacillota bacterium]
MIHRFRSGIFLIVVLVVLIASVPCASAGLPIKAKSAILIEAQTGEVLYEHNPDEKLPIASVTKIMTLVLALEALNEGKVSMDDVVVGSYLAKSMGGTQIWLEEGEQMSFRDMLYAVAVGSANDCAVAIGEYLGGSFDAFVEHMNRKAQELGMVNTHYANPTGLDAPDHYSTARDIAILSRYAVQLPLFLDLVSTWEYWVRQDTPQEVWLTSFNKLLKQYPGCDGIKTGYTSTAGYCLSATAKRNGLRLIAVALGSSTRDDRNNTIKALLDYGFQMYKAEKLVSQGESFGRLPVILGVTDSVELVSCSELRYPVKKGTELTLTKKVNLPETVTAPIAKDQVIGEVVFTDRSGKVVAKTEIVAAESIERAGFFKIIKQTVHQLLKALFFRK